MKNTTLRRLLTILLALLLAGFASSGLAQEKKKKQRGKVVKATIVEEAPAEEEQTAADESSDDGEDSGSASAEPRGEPVPDRDLEKELRKAEKQRIEAGKKADREREKANRQAEKEAKREAEQRARTAERDRKEASAAAERAAREEQRAAEAAAKMAADEERSAAAAASREAATAEYENTAEKPEVTASEAAEPTAATASASSAPRAAAPATTPATSAPTTTAAADPPPAVDRQDRFSEQVLVREVLLDVLVTDRDGNVVTGLGPEDFVVEERGETREVTSASFYGGPELRASGVEGDTRTDRYFILFFHDQKQAAPFLTAAQLDAGRWTKRWIEEEMLPNDQVAVMGYDARLKIYTDFTRDKEELLEAVTNASLGRKEPDRWKSRSEPEFSSDSPSILANLPTGKTLAKQTRRIQHALELVGQAAEGIVGRKNLLLFSVGYGDVDSQFGLYTPDPRFYPDMKESLNNGNVAVYAIDTMGSERGRPAFARINDSLSAIANDTGGHYYSTFVNALTPLRQVAEDNQGYYLLSYRAEYDAGTQGYREVEIKVPGKNYKVRARKGYRYGA